MYSSLLQLLIHNIRHSYNIAIAAIEGNLFNKDMPVCISKKSEHEIIRLMHYTSLLTISVAKNGRQKQ